MSKAVSPIKATNRLGLFAVFIPILGAIVVGIMARYGSNDLTGVPLH